MTETTINGVVIVTSQPITIRNGVVECGTDPDWQENQSKVLHSWALAHAVQQQMDAMQNMTRDEQMIRNSYGRTTGGVLRGW